LQREGNPILSRSRCIQKSFPGLRRVRVDERLRSLQAFGCQLQEHEAELVDVLVNDIGKPIRYARDEMARHCSHPRGSQTG